MKKQSPLVIILLTFLFIGGTNLYHHIQYKRQIKILTAINSQSITTFRIYPGVIAPVGNPISFEPSEPIVSDFFQALNDIFSYSPSHDTAQKEESWFLETDYKNDRLQIKFYIPTGKDKIVTGHFAHEYGAFQSHLLYQWYQQYSHRWLTPEASPPTPKP